MIYIATPTPHGLLTSAYVSTLTGLRSALDAKRLANGWLHVASSDVIMGRNVLANRALENPATTHVFFVDSDMQFRPEVLTHLLAADKPLVGCVYAKRMLDLAEVQKHLSAKPGRQLDEAIALASSFVVRNIVRGEDVTSGTCRVGGVGMGACLIQRKVFDTMVEGGSVREVRFDQPYRAMGLKPPIWNFFGLTSDKDGEQLSEDFSFCHRWARDCGGEVWALTGEAISHVGEMHYSATLKRHHELRRGVRTVNIPLAQITGNIPLSKKATDQ